MTGKIKCGASITTLSFISLVCSILYLSSYFFYYDPVGITNYELTFQMPDFDIIAIFFSLLSIAPCMLLTIYVIKYCKQYKATVLYPITCGLIAAYPLLDDIYTIIIYTIDNITIIKPPYFSMEIGFIIDIVIVASFTLLTINATKGLNKKKYTIIAVSVGLLYELLFLALMFDYYKIQIGHKLYLYTIINMVAHIKQITLYIALLLFGLNNKIPALVSASPKKEKGKMGKMSPQEELRLLKSCHNSEIITKEEYESKRADIINKL